MIGVSLLAVGCEEQGQQATPQRADLPELHVDASDNGSELQLALGQRMTIALAGNATTGYSWIVADITGDAVCQAGEVSYVSDSATRGAMGAGGEFYIPFLGEQVGESVIRLEYRRPWEAEQEPAETFTVTVNVTQ